MVLRIDEVVGVNVVVVAGAVGFGPGVFADADALGIVGVPDLADRTIGLTGRIRRCGDGRQAILEVVFYEL